MNTYIHYTTSDVARLILADNRLRYDMVGSRGRVTISSVCAVDARGVKSCVVPKDADVAIVFTTDTSPRVTFPEEALWDTDVVFSSASLVPATEADAMLLGIFPDPSDFETDAAWFAAIEAL